MFIYSYDIHKGFATSFKQNFKNIDNCAHLKEHLVERYDIYVS